MVSKDTFTCSYAGALGLYTRAPTFRARKVFARMWARCTLPMFDFFRLHSAFNTSMIFYATSLGSSPHSHLLTEQTFVFNHPFSPQGHSSSYFCWGTPMTWGQGVKNMGHKIPVRISSSDNP